MYTVNEETYSFTKLNEIIEQAAFNLRSTQKPDGNWDDCFDTGVMSEVTKEGTGVPSIALYIR